MENLEDRRVMAAFAFNSGSGLLTLTGTPDADVITVVQTGFTSKGQLKVDATVNDMTHSYTGVKSITVNAAAGDDTVSIGTDGDSTNPLELLGNVNVNLGAGADTCTLLLNCIGVVTVNDTNENNSEANQNDSVVVNDSIIYTLNVNLGLGNDSLEIYSSAVFTLTANLGVEKSALKPGFVDSDSLLIQDSAILIATLGAGTAEVVDDEGPTDEPNSEGPSLLDTFAGQNRFTIDSTIIYRLTIQSDAKNAKNTGNDKVDVIDITSGEEGGGIGPNIAPHLIQMAEDLQPVFTRYAATMNQVLTQVEQIVNLLGLQDTIDIPNIDFRETDVADVISDIFSRDDLSFINEIGDTTLLGIVAIKTGAGGDSVSFTDVWVLGAATIDTGAGDDAVYLVRTFVLGVLPPFTSPLTNPRLIITLGDGDDYLNVQDSLALAPKFDGGKHVEGDTYEASGNNVLLALKKSGFENTIISV